MNLDGEKILKEHRNELSDIQPADEMMISDLETVKVMSDPRRIQILQLLRTQPHSVKELSSALDIPPKKLYYHVNLMEKHGLIRVVGTRLVSGIVERRYRATAYLLMMDDALFGAENSVEEAIDTMLGNMFNQSRADIKEGLRTGLISEEDDAPKAQRLLSAWNLHRLTREEADDFHEKLCALLDELPSLHRDPEVG